MLGFYHARDNGGDDPRSSLRSGGGCGEFFARRDVLRGNQAVYDGIRTRDAAKLREYLAADFRWDAPDGKPRKRDEFLAGVAALPGDIVSVSGMRLSTTMRGDRVTVCGVQRAIVKLGGEEKIDDQPVLQRLAAARRALADRRIVRADF